MAVLPRRPDVQVLQPGAHPASSIACTAARVPARGQAAEFSDDAGRHAQALAYVEDFWFSRVLSGRDPHEVWATVDWRATPNFDWESAAGHSPDELHVLWSAAVDSSRHLWRTQAAQPGFTLQIDCGLPDGERVSPRWVLIHMIEEYARHCGHADLLREALDGAAGE